MRNDLPGFCCVIRINIFVVRGVYAFINSFIVLAFQPDNRVDGVLLVTFEKFISIKMVK